MNRDPIEDHASSSRRRSGVRERIRKAQFYNLYVFCNNSTASSVDYLGLLTVEGNCGCFNKESIESVLGNAWTYSHMLAIVEGIREPFGSAIKDHWDNMTFKCRTNEEYSECNGNRGLARLGVYRDIEYSYTTNTGGSGAVDKSKDWKTVAVLCSDQLCKKNLLQWVKTAIHETAHAIGWGNDYNDESDSSFDNRAPNIDRHHKQEDWQIP